MRRILFLLALGIALGPTVQPARALNIVGVPGNSTSGLGNFSATFTYTASSATAATIVVSITNTSPAANGGFLTAFVFNNPDNLITGVSLSSTSSTFDTLLGSPTFN